MCAPFRVQPHPEVAERCLAAKGMGFAGVTHPVMVGQDGGIHEVGYPSVGTETSVELGNGGDCICLSLTIELE